MFAQQQVFSRMLGVRAALGTTANALETRGAKLHDGLQKNWERRLPIPGSTRQRGPKAMKWSLTSGVKLRVKRPFQCSPSVLLLSRL